MATLPNLDAAVYARLAATSAVTALVGANIYAVRAPATTAYPYVTFFQVNGQMQNIAPRNMVNDLYQVDSWSDDQGEVANLHLAVYEALHQQVLTISGWTNTITLCESAQRMAEELDGKTIFHFLWTVRIRVSED